MHQTWLSLSFLSFMGYTCWDLPWLVLVMSHQGGLFLQFPSSFPWASSALPFSWSSACSALVGHGAGHSWLQWTTWYRRARGLWGFCGRLWIIALCSVIGSQDVVFIAVLCQFFKVFLWWVMQSGWSNCCNCKCPFDLPFIMLQWPTKRKSIIYLCSR